MASGGLTAGRSCENMLPMSITLRPRGRTARLPAANRSGYLLYDADCGICLATAGWLGKRVVREPAWACWP